MSTIDDVFSTVREAREDGPEALAALAVSYGAAALGGALRVGTLHGHLREARGYITSCEATLESERAKLDAARDEAKAARQRMEEVREQCDRARDDAEMCARQRDEARARASMLAQDLARVEAERDEAREALAAKDSAPDLDYPARAEVWKLRESVDALRSRAERAEAERDAAVQEREAFSLRLSAAERERDEARAERDASDERWATVCRECDVALAERDAVQALHAELVATRADFGHQRNITEDALRERDDARAALDLARESAREAREEIAGALALVDEARARVEAIAVERNAIVSELSQTTDAMMQARAERDALRDRPAYEARTVAPTASEADAHAHTGGAWLVAWHAGERVRSAILSGEWERELWQSGEGTTWLALDARRLPCAWPVVP